MSNKKLLKILVPTDGSKNSLRGMNLAILLAKATHSNIIGLNVYSLPLSVTVSFDVKNKTRITGEKIIKQAELLSKKANVPFTGITKFGENIGKTIINFADNQHVDMIIIGSRGPDSETGMFLGSVANYVVNKSKIPVTIVK